jgi:hypothetical protein
VRHDFSPALIVPLLWTILAAEISLYTNALFLGYRPFLSKNLPVKGMNDGGFLLDHCKTTGRDKT